MLKQRIYLVTETVVRTRRYIVESDTPSEGWELAENGETIDEETLRTESVIDREVEQYEGVVGESG